MNNKAKNITNTQYLLIKLQNIQYRKPQQSRQQIVYFSFSINQRMYFTSCMDINCPILTDDIVIPIYTQLPDIINLHRWQNHMIMFTHQIDISELKTRTTSKKKHQTKKDQILSFMILLLNQEQLKFGDKYVQSISQHYLIIQQIIIKEKKTQNRVEDGPNYFIIKTSQFDYVMPVRDGELCIKLPETLEFQHVKNGKTYSKSKVYNSDQFKQNSIQIQLNSVNGQSQQLLLKIKWGINFFQTKAQNSLLLQAHELIIYDIQVKFDSYNQFANSHVKFVYGNKSFQVGNQFNTAKPSKIKKIIYFIIKSQDQQINIIVQRNLKIVAQSKLYTDQIISYTVQNPKRKLLDDNGKIIGSIKFKCQKAKNLSTPNNNKFWKQCNKKKLINTVILSVSQISVQYDKDQSVCVALKSQNQQKVVNNIPNLLHYDQQNQISYTPVIVQAKGDENVYVMLRNQQQQKNVQNTKQNTNFIGISILNFAQLRLGANSAQIPFYKNLVKTATVTCLINKVTSYPFIKSTFQPQILHNTAHKTLSLSIFMKKITFTPYFYTFRYDNKDEVYCIVQANRLKKVLIMQDTIHDQLSFIPSTSSDNLNFYIQDTQYIKIKITFLVSDVGHEEEIYGFVVIKIKIGQFVPNQSLKFNKVEVKNQFGNDVGFISIQVYEGAKNNNKLKQKKQLATGPFKSDIKRVQNDLHKINQSMQIMQQSLKKKYNKNPQPSPALRKSQQIPVKKLAYIKPSIRYENSINYTQKRKQRNHSVAGTNNQSIKLPYLNHNGNGSNKKQKNNLKDLINMMKIRKRDNHGYYQQNNSNIVPSQPKYPVSQRAQYNKNKNKLYQPQFYTQNGSRQNPSTQRSLDAIPNKKFSTQNKQNLKNQISQYQQKIKNLKNALNNNNTNQIQNQHNNNNNDLSQYKNILDEDNNDHHEIKLINSRRKDSKLNVRQNGEEDLLEFEDNQFIRPAN